MFFGGNCHVLENRLLLKCRRAQIFLFEAPKTCIQHFFHISPKYVRPMVICLLKSLRSLKELSSLSSRLGQSILGSRWIESNIPVVPAYVSFPGSCGSEPTSILSILSDVFLWMAAPKKKTSHTRKRLRQLNYQLRNLNTIYECPLCGHSKRTHRLCLNCLKQRLLQLRSANKSPTDP